MPGTFVVGPIFHSVEVGLVSIVSALFSLPFGIGGFIWGALCQVIVVTGVHHALNLVEIEMLAKTKWNPVNPVGSCGIVAQAGAKNGSCSKKQNQQKMKSLGYPSAISALLGITEPAVFGVNLRLVQPFCMCMYRWWRRRMDRGTSRTERNRNVYHWYSGNALISE